MKSLLTYSFVLSMALSVCAQDFIKKDENDFYKIQNIGLPEGCIMEVGGMCTMPDGRIAISTRRGEVWIMENTNMTNNTLPRFSKYAEGVHECLGIAYKNGLLYVATRGELTRLIDYNHDGKADAYEPVAS